MSLSSFFLEKFQTKEVETSAMSANTDLDECLQKEQFEMTVVSAA